MFTLVNDKVRPMNRTEFRAWCERAGMQVVHIRKSPRGALRAFLANYVGKHRAHIAELSLDGKRCYLRRVDDTTRKEVLCEVWVTQ